MGCVQRVGVYVCFCVGLLVSSTNVFAKGSNISTDNAASDNAYSETFTWNENKKLSWDDFKGQCPADFTTDAAAATHCGFGYRIDTTANDGHNGVVVYNSFYANKSWVRADGRTPEVLTHEQGHFDLCELYARKFSAAVSVNALTAKDVQAIYKTISTAYALRQQDYENETQHGTDLFQQKRWRKMIERELSAGESCNTYSGK